MTFALTDIPSIVSSGTAVLLLGDLGETADGRSSLAILREEALKELNIASDPSTPLDRILGALRVASLAETDRIVGAHLSRVVAARSDLVRVIQGPWERIYSMSGLSFSNLDFEHLNHPVTHLHSCYPPSQAAVATLLIDDSPSPEQLPREFVNRVEATSERGIWHRELHAKAMTVPIVAVAREADDRLWACLDSRNSDGQVLGAESPQLPPCVLVLARITSGDKLMALSAGVTLVEATLADLAGAVAPGNTKVKQGHRLLARSRHADAVGVGVQQVATLTRGSSLPENWDFLRGYDPTWSDVVYNRPVRLNIHGTMYNACSIGEGSRNVVVLRARAGAGKTTTLMTLANDLSKSGLAVAWLDRSATQRSQDLLEEIRLLDPDCVFVDDADMFGDATPRILRMLNQSGRRLVVASVRTTRDRLIGSIPNARYVDESPLTDRDVELLHQVLADAGLLGALQGVLPLATRLQHIRELCQRDLLAALIEIVTGQKFEDRLQHEFGQLHDLEREVLRTVSYFVSNVGQALSLKKEVLLQCIAGGTLPERLGAVQSLMQQRMLHEDAHGLRVRHRSIASALISGLSRGDVADSHGHLLTYYVERAHAIHDASDPQRRTMVALLSHTLMVRANLPVDRVRAMYAAIQRFLPQDFHFWLQRGAYETEKGDDELAHQYLKAARSCPGGLNDHKVITESGLLALRRAKALSGDFEAQSEALAAIAEMMRVTRVLGGNSPHTFKILAESGLAFANDCSTLTAAEREDLLARLDETVGIGLSVCQDNTVAINALEKYVKTRSSAKAIKPIVYPLPNVNAKPKPPRRRS